MKRIFTFLYSFFHKNPIVFWIVLFLIFGVSAFFASSIELEQDINKMIPHDPKIEAMNDVLHKTKTSEQTIFTLQFKDEKIENPDSLIILQEKLQDELEIVIGTEILHFETSIGESKEQEFIQVALDYLPLFLTEEDYDRIEELIQVQNVKQSLAKQQQILVSPAGMVAGQWISSDPIGLIGLAFEKFKSLDFDSNYQLYQNVLFNNNFRKLHFFVKSKYSSSETGKNKEVFSKVDQVVENWKIEYPELKILYFGAPAVAAGNAKQMQKDTLVTLSITVLLLISLVWYIFKRKRAAVLLMIPVIFGCVFGLGMTAIIQETVSIIALGAGAVILGIAVDFSVHFMSHSRTSVNMKENISSLVFPLTLGALTTIGAFWGLRYANAPILQDIGTFAAFSLLGASLFTLIFLPHLLDKFKVHRISESKLTFLDRLATYKPERSKILFIAVLVLTPVFWYFSGKVKFQSDLMQLNYLSPELHEAQEELNKDNSFAMSSMFLVAKGINENSALRSLEENQAIIENLKKEGKIDQILNPSALLPSLKTQQEKINRWETFWNQERTSKLINLVNSESIQLGFKANAFSNFEQLLEKDYHVLDGETSGFLKKLMPNSFGSIDSEFFAVAILKVAQEDRKEIMDKFSESSIIVTDRQAVSEALLRTLQLDFNKIFLIAGILVFVALLIAYGRIELALITFIPLAITWIWILGLMAILGLEFNIVNIVISTLIFGLGDDYSIFMMDGLLEKYKTGKNKIKTARSAVYLSVLTTIIGLGTLIFAEHPALKSIALVSILGLICVIFVSQVTQPVLFNFLIQKRADKGFMPFTLLSLLKSVFSFLYFFIGCLLLTLLGVFLMGIKPFGKGRSKYIFHLFISNYTKSLLYVMSNVKKKIRIDPNQQFLKPAVYIANHSSFLDILIVTMLHPKLILLTNKWVWNSPLFGKIVKMAEYYPIVDGADASLNSLQSMIDYGYGIIVFPEGTRSEDGHIGRFHKGAFFIAEKLNLDIIPIVIHGAAYTMQKGDFLLKDGTLTVRVLQPFENSNPTLGISYQERTKTISRFFKTEYQNLKLKEENTAYFREQLIKSYLYKGPVLEWYCKVKTKIEDNYSVFHDVLPKEGLIYDLGCGYGFMSYILSWTSSKREMIGIDYDGGKIEIAKQNYTNNIVSKRNRANVSFFHKDLKFIELRDCKGIVIADVLHYLFPEDQEKLLEKCWHALDDKGVLIIRDGISDLKHKHKNTQWTEFMSTKILHFNQTGNDLHFLDFDFFERFAFKYNLKMEIREEEKRTSNLIFIFRK